MIKFLAGVIVGITLASVGFSGITRILDKGVDSVREQTQQIAR